MKYKVQMPILLFIWLDKGINITVRLRLPIVRVKPDVSSLFFVDNKSISGLFQQRNKHQFKK